MEQDNSNLQKWMQEAFVQAEEAIAQFEVPVGAVFVAHPRKQSRTRKLEDEFDVTQGSVVGRGHNITNATRNVRLSYIPLRLTLLKTALLRFGVILSIVGFFFFFFLLLFLFLKLPSQALQHAEYVALQQIISEGKYRPEDLVLYVTVEPCVMFVHSVTIRHFKKKLMVRKL
jgi:tRNA(Arg) A34 adenosine deaminase TadA